MKSRKNERGAIGSNLIKVGIFAAIAFVLIAMATTFIPNLMTGFEAGRKSTYPRTEQFTELTRTVADNSCLVNVTEPVWQNWTTEVTAVASNETTDVPIVDSATGTQIKISGLGGGPFLVNYNRSLNVTYNYGMVAKYTGLGTVIAMGPGLIVLGFVIVIAVKHFLGIKI